MSVVRLGVRIVGQRLPKIFEEQTVYLRGTGTSLS